MTSKRRPWRWVILGVLLVAVAISAVAFFGRPKAAPASYDLVEVTRSTQEARVALSGTIEPREKAEATFRVAGTVTDVMATVGRTVSAGDALARLDASDLSDALALARAQESAARAQLQQIRGTKGATASAIEAARAQVRSAEASTRAAQTKLDHATLTAPIAGTVARVGLAVGDTVTGNGSGGLPTSMSGLNPGDLTGLTGGAAQTGASASGSIVIIATDAWQLEATVGTADLANLKAGQKATVTPTGTTHVLTGKVSTVGLVADAKATTPSYPVTITLDKTHAPLFAGSDADAVVTVGTFTDVLTVPVDALRQDGSRTTVMLQRGSEAIEREVVVGRLFDGRREVTSGLDAGDRVQVPKAHTTASPRSTP